MKKGFIGQLCIAIFSKKHFISFYSLNTTVGLDWKKNLQFQYHFQMFKNKNLTLNWFQNLASKFPKRFFLLVNSLYSTTIIWVNLSLFKGLCVCVPSILSLENSNKRGSLFVEHTPFKYLRCNHYGYFLTHYELILAFSLF